MFATINNVVLVQQPQAIHYARDIDGHNNQRRRNLVYTHTLFNEHTTIIAVNIIVSNVKKQPQAVHLAISETRRCRATNLGEYSHHNNDAQYVAMHTDKTDHISNKPHCTTTMGTRVEKGQKSWFRIIIIHIYSGHYLSE